MFVQKAFQEKLRVIPFQTKSHENPRGHEKEAEDGEVTCMDKGFEPQQYQRSEKASGSRHHLEKGTNLCPEFIREKVDHDVICRIVQGGGENTDAYPPIHADNNVEAKEEQRKNKEVVARTKEKGIGDAHAGVDLSNKHENDEGDDIQYAPESPKELGQRFF